MATDLSAHTLVLGAGSNPQRYAHKAACLLMDLGYSVLLLGKEAGNIRETPILSEWNSSWKVHTVTLYLNPLHQEKYYEKILALKPERVIFNPGTENPHFQGLLSENGIFYEEACTLVLLNLGQYDR